MARYVVPYTAPGIRSGSLTVIADSAPAALTAAQAIHARRVTLHRFGSHQTLGLSRSERAQIIYGEVRDA